MAAITSVGGQAVALQGDFSKPDAIARSFDEITSMDGRLDILINNAAAFKFNAIETITVEGFHRHFDLNVLGLLLATQAAGKLMGSGGIDRQHRVCVSSMSAARSTVYAAGKGAVDSITTALIQRARTKAHSCYQPQPRRR